MKSTRPHRASRFMRMMGVMVALACLTGVFAACSNHDERQPDGEGYIFQIEGGRILVLDRVDPEDFGKEWADIFGRYEGDAMWLGTRESGLKVGMYVEYWIEGGVNDSYPGQAFAKKINIIKDAA